MYLYRPVVSSSPCRSQDCKTPHPPDKRLQKLDDLCLIHSATTTPQNGKNAFLKPAMRVCVCVFLCVCFFLPLLSGWLACRVLSDLVWSCLVLSVCLFRSHFMSQCSEKSCDTETSWMRLSAKDCWLVLSTPNLPPFAWKKTKQMHKPPTPCLLNG